MNLFDKPEMMSSSIAIPMYTIGMAAISTDMTVKVMAIPV